MNFDSSELKSDNILHQLKSFGHSTVFYGDDTWLKLFPSTFKRSEGTTSFFVSDYTEVCLSCYGVAFCGTPDFSHFMTMLIEIMM